MQKKTFTLIAFALVLMATVMSSCSHGITIQDAANGKAKCGKNHLK
jgi:predicted small secreted protein